MKWIAEGLRLLPFIVGAVHAVESLCTSKRGQDKQDAAVNAVRAMVAAVENGARKDLVDDREVELAIRDAIDAYVHLENIVARKAASPPATTGGPSSFSS